jgi:hypothetical protein
MTTILTILLLLACCIGGTVIALALLAMTEIEGDE